LTGEGCAACSHRPKRAGHVRTIIARLGEVRKRRVGQTGVLALTANRPKADLSRSSRLLKAD